MTKSLVSGVQCMQEHRAGAREHCASRPSVQMDAGHQIGLCARQARQPRGEPSGTLWRAQAPLAKVTPPGRAARKVVRKQC